MMSEASRKGGLFKLFPPPPNQHDCNPCRTKPWISISKEKGECPLHAPLALPAPPYTVLVTLVTPWAECRLGGPTKQTLVSPHNSPWWWLTLLFMERAGGSCNTLQIIAHPRSPPYSPSLTPHTYLFSLLSFHLSDTFPLSSAQYLHLRIIHFSFFNFPLFFFFHPSTQGWPWGPPSSLTADGGGGLQEVSVI